LKSAEIVTSHNVVIQYEIAPVLLRVVASILDIVIVFFYFLMVTLLFSAIIGSSFGMDSFTQVSVLFLYICLLPGFFYSFLCEALLGGQTFGKMALGIRVLNVSGENASIGDLFLRWSFRIIDIIASVGALGLIVALSNSRAQRLGDSVANTILIKLRPSNEFSITDILNIKSSKDYEPTYPSIVQMSDDDMLLIKNSMDRLKKNPNDSHKKLVRELADLTAGKLGLSATPDKKITFLKTTLQDYIVLTRS
jgi:uncharacterized RDD family membrane protein YckC